MTHNERPDVLTEAKPFVQQCGPCDAGLPMSCTCPPGDYRHVMVRLMEEVQRLRAEREHMEMHPAGTVEWLKNRVNELTAERDQLTAYNRAVKGANDDLRAELTKARQERDEYAEDNTRVAVALVDVQRQLATARQETTR